MAKTKVKKTTKSKDQTTWHFFLPAFGGFLITWLFSQSFMLSLQVGVVVLLFSYLGRYLSNKK